MLSFTLVVLVLLQLSTHTPSHISHGTGTIMTQYETGRTEIRLGPFYFCIWVSTFLVEDSPIEGTLTSTHLVAYLPSH
jgi:hypothetical protein